MFDIGWSEILLIVVVAIVVVGPKDLPPMLRAFGRTIAKMRKMAGEFQGQFNEALREAELDDVKKSFDELRGLNPMNEIRRSLDPLSGPVAKPAEAPVPPPAYQLAQPATPADLESAAAAPAEPAPAEPAPEKPKRVRKPKVAAAPAADEPAAAGSAAPGSAAPGSAAPSPAASDSDLAVSVPPKRARAARVADASGEVSKPARKPRAPKAAAPAPAGQPAAVGEPAPVEPAPPLALPKHAALAPLTDPATTPSDDPAT